jgi:hypothetical protein
MTTYPTPTSCDARLNVLDQERRSEQAHPSTADPVYLAAIEQERRSIERHRAQLREHETVLRSPSDMDHRREVASHLLDLQSTDIPEHRQKEQA